MTEERTEYRTDETLQEAVDAVLQEADVAPTLFETARQLPEAPVLVWTKFVDAHGYLWTFTARAGLPEGLADEASRSVIRQMGNFKKAADHYGWQPYPDGSGPRRFAPAPTPNDNASPPPPGGGQGTSPPTGAPPAELPSGVEEIDFIRITAPQGKAQVEFWRVGRKYPELKWSLGGERLLAIAPQLAERGWQAEHFEDIGQEHPLALMAHWQQSPKNAKWKDVTRVEFRQ
jgi:hypothetical protein